MRVNSLFTIILTLVVLFSHGQGSAFNRAPLQDCLEGFIEQPSYKGERLPGTVILGFSDGYSWLVGESIHDRTVSTCGDKTIEVARGDRSFFSHVLQTHLVKQTPIGPADLIVTNTAKPDNPASGTRLGYTITVRNEGPTGAGNVVVNVAIPVGTTFASSVATPVSSPTVGAGAEGPVMFSFKFLNSGQSITINLEVNVLAASGSVLTCTATADSDAPDPVPSNNTAIAATTVKGGGVVELKWEQPPSTASNPTPAPINLQVGLVTATTDAPPDKTGFSPAEGDPCLLREFHIYKAEQLPVQIVSANLWKVVPPEQLNSSMATAPGGSFYVVTSVWDCDGNIVESGGSNQAGTPAGPDITSVNISSKIKAKGGEFSGTVELFVDGVGFSKRTKVKSATLVQQKGKLDDGTRISEMFTPGKTLIITIRNSNGGVGSFSYTVP